jgi:hypothetical protein
MQAVPDIVFHASIRRGMTRLEPRVGTHGQAWIYAARNEVFSMMFLTKTDDFVCASGDDNMAQSCT